jgi:hypothetical protein
MIGSITSFGTLLRLAAAGSRADRYRLVLVALGTTLGTIFSLAAFVVLTIDGYDDRYTNNLLKEPGLRPGVATGCWLLLIPVLIFIGMCTRVCASQRERRFAIFRLAGATPRQVRVIAAAETGISALAGALLGLAVFLVIRSVLASRVGDEERLSLPVSEPFPWTVAILFCLLMPLLAGLAGALAMRGVVIGPLGVARRHRRDRPPGWPAILLVSGPFAIAIANRLTALDLTAVGQPMLIIGVAATCIGILMASAWMAAACGRLTARLTGRPDLLIAARRLETDPYGQSWAISSVVICAFLASAVAVLKADVLSTQRSNEEFYARSFELVDLGLLIGVSIAAAGLLVALAEGILERRRSLAALIAAGAPLGTLRRAVLFQGLLSLVPSVLLAITLGSMAFFAITGSSLDSQTVEQVTTGTGSIVTTIPGSPFPFSDIAVIAIVGVMASLFATSLSLPFLDRSVRPAELRFE